jgi:hypothetical protein
MTSVAEAPRTSRWPDVARVRAAVAARVGTAAFVAAGLTVLVLVSLWLRTRALDASFWIDEGLAIGFASKDLLDIPTELRKDGSPPLYYLVLHVWMQMFGNGEVAVHVLSLIFVLLTIPAAFWAGRTLFGSRAGWVAAVFAAVSPFLTFYAQEARMYAMVSLCGIVVAATFCRAFADRDRRAVYGFGVSLAALLYLHNWGLFFGMAALATFVALWRWWTPADERRSMLRDGAIGFGLAALLYLPWVPTLIFQARNTGAPWATVPGFDDLLTSLFYVMGGKTAAVVLALVAGNALAGVLQARTALSRRTFALLSVGVGGILIAWLVSTVSPAYANRYFAVFIGPLLLLAAAGVARAGRLGLIAFVVIIALWFTPRTAAIDGKSNVRSVSASIQTLITSGDIVVAAHPEQLPVLAHYLPEGPRWANTMGFVSDETIFDWRDCTARLQAAKPKATKNRLVRALRRGQELVLVEPIFRTYVWDAPWTELVKKRAVQWERRLDADPRMRREAVVPVFGYDPLPRGVRAIVYRRVR